MIEHQPDQERFYAPDLDGKSPKIDKYSHIFVLGAGFLTLNTISLAPNFQNATADGSNSSIIHTSGETPLHEMTFPFEQQWLINHCAIAG